MGKKNSFLALKGGKAWNCSVPFITETENDLVLLVAGLWAGWYGFQIPRGEIKFFFLSNAKTGSGVHSAFLFNWSFSGFKAAGACSLPLASF